MVYTGFYANVWFEPEMMPVMRKVYCDGKRWWIRNENEWMRLDDASGYVILV